MKKARPLTHEDVAIWNKVSRTVRPLVESTFENALKMSEDKLKVGSYTHLPPAPAPVLHKTWGEIQSRADAKTRKGKISIDKKIDLHDLTRDQAFPVLVNKLTRAHKGGARCVLVVTGKGTNLEGVLRMSLPGWLMDAKIRPMIASFAPSHIRHGGSGAFYVFLKRKIG